MNLIKPGRYFFVPALLLIAVLVFAGCGGPSRKCLLKESNISTEYFNGMVHLEENKPGLATGIFNGILACDNHYSPAYSGLAVAYAQVAAAGFNLNNKSINASLRALYYAKKYASGNEDDFRRSIAAIRAYTTYKSPGWFRKVENEFRHAMKTRVEQSKLVYYESSDAASYFIGNAYFDSGRIENAMAEYKSLIEVDKDGRWGRLAQIAYNRSALILSNIERAEGEPKVVVLAFRSRLTRAEVAAILIGELRVDRLLQSHEVQLGVRGTPVPVDILKSPYRAEIMKILKLGIKGLTSTYSRPSSSYLFRPLKVVTRKDYAIIIDDIQRRLAAGPSAFSLMERKKRTFADVPPKAPWYEAVMNITSLNILVPLDGREFRPYDNLDGPDAFSAVMGLKDGLEPQ